MDPHKTTLVFVPGAHHLPECFDDLIEILQPVGYQIRKVYLPCVVLPGKQPTESRQSDVDEIRKHIATVVDDGNKVILIMHSYGCTPGSEAVEGFEQTTLNHPDGRGVVHLVYMTTWLALKGQSLMEFVMERPPSTNMTMSEDGLSGTIQDADEVFYNDFHDPAKVEKFCRALLPMSLKPVAEPLRYEAWRNVPASYIMSGEDNCIPFWFQRRLVDKAKAAGALDIKTRYFPTASHSVFASMPRETSIVIREAAGDKISAEEEKLISTPLPAPEASLKA